MKYWMSLLFIIFLFKSYSQNINGNWYGNVTTDDGIARVMITFYQEKGKDKCYISSPEFGGDQIIFFDSIARTKNKMVLSFKKSLKIFADIVNDTLMKGMFKNDQPAIYRAIRLIKVKTYPGLSKPQTPRLPFPYKSNLVLFKDTSTRLNYKGVTTIPFRDSLVRKNFPALILLPGTGTHDMDYKAGGHRFFMVLADYFTRNGFVVLRKESRFYGDKSKNFEDVTLPETVADAEAALRFLKRQTYVDTARIGVLGHSEGGLVAAAFAAKNPEIKFMILMASPGIPAREIFVAQQKVAKDEFFKKYQLPSPLKNISPDSLKGSTPRTKYLFDNDPSLVLSKLTIPVLALNGDKDLQVNAANNIAAIDSALKVAGNKKYKTLILPGVNHNFQKCIKCTFREGVFLEETISPDVLQLIMDWLDKFSKSPERHF